MTVLITGAAGFMGNNITRRLVNMGTPVRAMVSSIDKANKRLGDIASRIEIVRGDVTDRDGLKKLMDGVTTVIHLVAIPMEKGRSTYEAINYQGTVNVVDAARLSGVERFINMSQNGARSDHFSEFLRSKGRAQEYVTHSGLKWTALRPSAVFGPQDEFFNTFARLVRLTPLVFPLIGGGKAQFQPVSIDDVVEATVRSLSDDTTIGKELVLGGPEVLTLGEIERRVLKALGSSRALVSAPVGLLRPAVFVMEKVLPGSPVNLTLLDLLKEPNVTPNNALVSHFNITPKAFAGDNLDYLRKNTAGDALKKFFTGAPVN